MQIVIHRISMNLWEKNKCVGYDRAVSYGRKDNKVMAEQKKPYDRNDNLKDSPYISLVLNQCYNTLKKYGITTIGELIDCMNIHGKDWYKAIPWLGKKRGDILWNNFVENGWIEEREKYEVARKAEKTSSCSKFVRNFVRYE